MISFATLFLGLSLGVQSVEVLVTDDVARVELRLDGELAAAIEGPPWQATCDFGSELAPRRLVAIAFDAAGAELGRTERRLNVPQGWAVVELLIEDGATPGSTTVALRWETSTVAGSPRAWAVTFDGRAVEVADPRRFALPPYDPATAHFLRAELTFPPNVQASAESVFGGRYGSAVATDLTAVPTIPEGGRRLDPAAAQKRTAWGEVADVSSLTRMKRALGHLSNLLERQRVVWVEGRLLPQEVTSVDEGILRLVGAVEVEPVATEELIAQP